MSLEKAGEVLVLEWGGGEGDFDTRVERVFKVRCIGDCEGHVGYVSRLRLDPHERCRVKMALSAAEEAAKRRAWIDRQDERWREKYQITGRERLEVSIPGGQRVVSFIPLEGWKIERGLWELTTRPRSSKNVATLSAVDGRADPSRI